MPLVSVYSPCSELTVLGMGSDTFRFKMLAFRDAFGAIPSDKGLAKDGRRGNLQKDDGREEPSPSKQFGMLDVFLFALVNKSWHFFPRVLSGGAAALVELGGQMEPMWPVASTVIFARTSLSTCHIGSPPLPHPWILSVLIYLFIYLLCLHRGILGKAVLNQNRVKQQHLRERFDQEQCKYCNMNNRHQIGSQISKQEECRQRCSWFGFALLHVRFSDKFHLATATCSLSIDWLYWDFMGVSFS